MKIGDKVRVFGNEGTVVAVRSREVDVRYEKTQEIVTVSAWVVERGEKAAR